MLKGMPVLNVGSVISESMSDLRTGEILVAEGTVITPILRDKIIEYMQTRFTRFNKPTIDTITDTSGLSDLIFPELLFYANSIIEDLVINNQFADSLQLLKNYDINTYQHCLNVAILSVVFGLHLELPQKKLKWLAIGALVHDIGKLSTPESILLKKDKLTNEEFSIIKFHADKGKQILQESYKHVPIPVIEITGQHHENWNGTGYPNRLKGKEIYQLAMIVHTCDVYDALVQKRSYKDPMPKEVVWNNLIGDSGRLFDPYLFSEFCNFMPGYLVGEHVWNKKILDNNLEVTVFAYDTEQPFNPVVSCNKEILRLNVLMERY